MSFAYALKVLTDELFYFTIISMFAPSAGMTGMLLTTPLILAAAAYFCFALKDRRPAWLRFLPLLSIALVFALCKSTADRVVSVPAAAYAFWYVWKRPMAADYRDALSRFFLCLKILPCAFIFGALVGNWTAMQNIVLPYFFMFLVLSVILLRTLRHDNQTISQTKFKLLNIAGVGVVGLVGWALSSGLMMRVFRAFGSLLIRFIIRPILMLVLYAFAGIMYLISLLFSGIEWDPSDLDLQQLGENLEMGDFSGLFANGEETAEQSSPIADYILIGLAVVAAIAIVIIIFRALARHGGREEENDFQDVREIVEDDGANRRGNPRENRERVRNYYRKYLTLSEKRGFELSEFQDSSEIERGTRYIYRNSANTDLREVYVRARYSSQEVSDGDVRAAKEAYNRLRKNETDQEASAS